MYCATVAYPTREGDTFDFDYFLQQYVPMFVDALGDNCVRFEVRKGLNQPGAPEPPYVCVANFWVQSGERFGATLAQYGDRLYGDISRFTTIGPVRAWEEVIGGSELSHEV
jgi:uncharacterized protein (TIGR02118 family)